MAKADIKGSHATAKGLRHPFAVVCVENNIPLPAIQKMLGHSSITLTAHYLDLIGTETRSMISRTSERTCHLTI